MKKRAKKQAAASPAPIADMSWLGITRRAGMNERPLQQWDALADAARAGRWDEVFVVLAEDRELVNTSRLGGRTGNTALHHAARLGAPNEIVQRLLLAGAWRTLKNAKGERAVDIARRTKRSAHLVSLLEPPRVLAIPPAALAGLQRQFHAVMRERAKSEIRANRLRLPELEPLTEFALGHQFWCAVPGMYGGFSYRLTSAGADPKLVAVSWCRVVEGSEECHEITKKASVRIEPRTRGPRT